MRKINREEKNIFSILNVQNQEIYLSNMLAYLMGTDTKISSYYINQIVEKSNYKYLDNDFSSERVVKMKNKTPLLPELTREDAETFSVYREYSFDDENGKGFIDILAVSEEKKIVICIENKIGSSEHSNQLARYAGFVEKTYNNEDGYYNVFIYLTPNGEIPSDCRWKILRYSDIRDITDAHLQYMRQFPTNFDSKITEFIKDYKDLLSYVIVSELNFQNYMKSFNSEFLGKDFPDLEVAKITPFNVLYRDKSLTQFASSNIPGGYLNNTDLCYICIKSEAEQREKGTLEASFIFTNHPDNLASGSAFRKTFPNAGESFRWYTPIKIEKQLCKENETLWNLSDETRDKFNDFVKELITELKGKINL